MVDWKSVDGNSDTWYQGAGPSHSSTIFLFWPPGTCLSTAGLGRTLGP